MTEQQWQAPTTATVVAAARGREQAASELVHYAGRPPESTAPSAPGLSFLLPPGLPAASRRLYLEHADEAAREGFAVTVAWRANELRPTLAHARAQRVALSLPLISAVPWGDVVVTGDVASTLDALHTQRNRVVVLDTGGPAGAEPVTLPDSAPLPDLVAVDRRASSPRWDRVAPSVGVSDAAGFVDLLRALDPPTTPAATTLDSWTVDDSLLSRATPELRAAVADFVAHTPATAVDILVDQALAPGLTETAWCRVAQRQGADRVVRPWIRMATTALPERDFVSRTKQLILHDKVEEGLDVLWARACRSEGGEQASLLRWAVLGMLKLGLRAQAQEALRGSLQVWPDNADLWRLSELAGVSLPGRRAREVQTLLGGAAIYPEWFATLERAAVAPLPRASGTHAPLPEGLRQDALAQPLVSACLIVKDEEDFLSACLQSLHQVVDEVVIYDTGSTDRTVELARAAGAKVIEGYWDDNFARARNAALEHCTGEWVLWIDADETLVCFDIRELRGTLQAYTDADAMTVDIYNETGDGTAPGNSHRALRFFRRARCEWYGSLHEQVSLRGGQPGILRGATLTGPFLRHSGYMDQVVVQRDKLARNIRLAEAGLLDEDKVIPAHRGLPRVNLARSLGAAGRYLEAMPHYERALEQADAPIMRRSVLMFGAFNLSYLGRWEEAAEWARQLKAISTHNPVADYLEGAALHHLGRVDEAIALLQGIDELCDQDGYRYPEALVRGELASALVEQDRADEAIVYLLRLIEEDPSPANVVTAARLLVELDRPLSELAGVIPEHRLDYVGAALLLVPAAWADAIAQSLLDTMGTKAPILASAIRFAPLLGAARAVQWSARLRAIGMAEHCPLIRRAADATLRSDERALAAATAFAAFQDRRSPELLAELLGSCGPEEAESIRPLVRALSPDLDHLVEEAESPSQELISPPTTPIPSLLP